MATFFGTFNQTTEVSKSLEENVSKVHISEKHAG